MSAFYNDTDENTAKEVTETKNDGFLPNVGIVMSNTAIDDGLDTDDVILEGDIMDGSRPSSLSVSKPTDLKVNLVIICYRIYYK